MHDRDGRRWRVRRFDPSLGPARTTAIVSGDWARSRASVAEGWLTFECEATGWIRRLAPAPADWADCDEATLLGYLEAARRSRPRPMRGPLP